MTIRFTCLSAEAAGPLIAMWTTPADRAHVARRRSAAARDALAARAALRALLAKETGHGVWDLRAEASGKPFAWTPDGQPGPAITLAHSAGATAVAVGAPGTALGIDIERHKPRGYDDIALHVFGPAERDAVKADGADAFYRIWTAREARAKATGGGISEILLRQDLTGAGANLGYWQQNGFFFRHHRPFHLYSLTIAADAPLARTSAVCLV